MHDACGHYTVRSKIIGNEMIKNVGKSQSCMVSKLPIIFKRTRSAEPRVIRGAHVVQSWDVGGSGGRGRVTVHGARVNLLYPINIRRGVGPTKT